jgi:DAK2 domain fusion protein YloV
VTARVDEAPAGGLALDVARAALAALEASRERLDDLNIYPVPDGDTGTNMTLTARAAATALERDPGADLTRAVLMGARGNSGVILSQLVRGAMEALGQAEALDVPLVARALRAASDAGYAAVREPEEGTILTVARELAERAEALPPDLALPEALAELVAHGELAVARTQEQLDVLREAGVVDAGGAGLLEVMRGIAAHVRGEPLPEAAAGAGPLPLEAVHRERSRYRYCTSFFVEGDGADPARLEDELARLGDSLLVVGGPGTVKVHVHTDEPGAALALGTAAGVVEEVDIRNMHAETADREERLTVEEALTSAVAVCAGAGNRRLFESLGAGVVAGGQSMNPSTAEIAAAIEAARADHVVLLPNNENVVLAAEQAAELSGKRVHVVPTETMQAGLGALVAFDPGRPLEENAADMEEAARAVRAGALARASRTTTLGALEVEQGHFLGLLEGEPVACGPALEPVAREVVERLVGEATAVVTILVGEELESADELAQAVREAHPGLEVEVHEGGQPHYPLLFSAE